MTSFDCDVAIVGGGAAGLATAIFTARECPAARITICDGARTLGAKILISGGGRCNVTNRVVSAADFNGGSAAAVSRVLRALSVKDTVAFFGGLGVALREEPRGKLFPDTNRARTVLDALVGECRGRGIAVRTSTRVQEAVAMEGGFRLETSGGLLTSRRLVLAAGGLSLARTGSDGHGYRLACALGHTLVPTTPALVPLVLDGDLHAGLAGVSHPARVNVRAPGTKARTCEGPMLWTHTGVSGPAILDASRHFLRHRLEGRVPSLVLTLAGADFETTERWLLEEARERPRLRVASAISERLPASLAERLTERAGAASFTLATLPRDVRRALVRLLVDLHLPVRDSRGYDHAEVTAGGIALDEVDPSTMASRTCPRLFLVGEMLDVDGRLGGFNFQWAWSSARAAAAGIAASFV